MANETNLPDIRLATKTCISSVILNSNPWEQRDLDRKLSRIQTERKRKERTMDRTQRRFYINQVFDQHQNIKFPNLSGTDPSQIPKIRRAETHDDLVNVVPNFQRQDSSETEETINKRKKEKKKRNKRENSKTKLKGKAVVIAEPSSITKEEELNRKAGKLSNVRKDENKQNDELEDLNNAASVPTLPCIDAHRTGSAVYFSRNNIKRHLTMPLRKPEPLNPMKYSRSANITTRLKEQPLHGAETVIHEVTSSEDSLQQSSKATDAISKKIREREFKRLQKIEDLQNNDNKIVIIGPGFDNDKPKTFLTREPTNLTNNILIPMPKHSQGHPQLSTRILERLRWQNEMQQGDIISKLTGTLPSKLMAKANESLIATLGNSRDRLISREKEIVNRVSTEDSRWLRLSESLVTCEASAE